MSVWCVDQENLTLFFSVRVFAVHLQAEQRCDGQEHLSRCVRAGVVPHYLQTAPPGGRRRASPLTLY